MYFKGLWASKFLPQDTKKEVFYTRHRNTLVPMMRQKGNFRYCESPLNKLHFKIYASLKLSFGLGTVFHNFYSKLGDFYYRSRYDLCL